MTAATRCPLCRLLPGEPIADADLEYCARCNVVWPVADVRPAPPSGHPIDSADAKEQREREASQ